MQCFWPADTLDSPLSASWSEGSNDCMSPNERLLIARPTASPPPFSLSGYTQSVLPNEWSSMMPTRSRLLRASTAAWAVCLPQ